MTKDEAHDLECARAAICFLIEQAKEPKEKKELRAWLREIEQKYNF